MAAILSHRDLLVWQKSVALASKIHAATREFQDGEGQGLSAQMRRCAVSVASTIAEGAGRSTRSEYIQFLNLARGSLAALETQILITRNLNLIGEDQRLEEDAAEIGRLLAGLIRKLREQRGR